MRREKVDLPPGVNPHDGKELSLMLAGRKPLAMFYDTLPECGVIPRREFDPYVTVGRVISSEVTFLATTAHGPVRFVFYAQPWATDDMVELQEIHRHIHEGSLADSPELETRIGHLLGYTDQEIGAYLTWRTYVLDHVLR